MVRLTPKLVRKLCPETKSAELQELVATDQGITEVGSLASCSSLTHLDLSQNAIRDIGGLRANERLKWLNLAQNQLRNLDAIIDMKNLQVVNASQNNLSGGLRLLNLPSLGALILSDNNIDSLQGLENMPKLNTLVLKHNAIASLGTVLHGSSVLQKLSAAHNRLHELGHSLMHCTALVELRLGNNKLQGLPQELACNARLRILDLGSNPIENTSQLKVLAELPWLRNMNLKGCPIASSADYPHNVMSLLPHVEVLDSKRIGTRSRKGNTDTISPTEEPESEPAVTKDSNAARVAHVPSKVQKKRASAGVIRQERQAPGQQDAALAARSRLQQTTGGEQKSKPAPGLQLKRHFTADAAGMPVHAGKPVVGSEPKDASQTPWAAPTKTKKCKVHGAQHAVAGVPADHSALASNSEGPPTGRTMHPSDQAGQSIQRRVLGEAHAVLEEAKLPGTTDAASQQDPPVHHHLLQDVTIAKTKKGKDDVERGVVARGANATQLFLAQNDVDIGSGQGCAW